MITEKGWAILQSRGKGKLLCLVCELKRELEIFENEKAVWVRVLLEDDYQKLLKLLKGVGP